MTCRETLYFFGRLRGIPRDLVGKEVEQMLQKLTLTPHADKTTESCSGGNKRKLSLGIALIGAKPSSVLLIDEPSSGLDPVARRKGMWSLISDFSKDRSVILTTHSMHEAEALCSRVAIMKDGQLLCLGSVQQLKVSRDAFLVASHFDISLNHTSTAPISVEIFEWIHH